MRWTRPPEPMRRGRLPARWLSPHHGVDDLQRTKRPHLPTRGHPIDHHVAGPAPHGPSTKVRLGATHHTPSRHAPRDTTPHPPRRNTRHTQTDTETAGRGDTVFPRSTAARVSTPECPHQGRYASLPRSACGRPLTRPPGRRNPAAVRDQGKDRTEHGHNPRPEPPETDHSRPCPGATHQVSHRRRVQHPHRHRRTHHDRLTTTPTARTPKPRRNPPGGASPSPNHPQHQ